MSSDIINSHQENPEGWELYYLWNGLTTVPQMVEGEYVVEIVLTDKISGKTTTASCSFSLIS